MFLYLPDLIGLLLLATHATLAWSHLPALSDPGLLFGSMALVVLVLIAFRLVHATLDEDHWFHRWADWWMCLALVPIYLNLNQLVDASRRPLMDSALIRVDQMLLGVQPSVWFSHHMHPLLTDWLYLCYASYYFFVVGVGIWLGRAASRRVFHAYIAAICGTFFLMMFGYMAVPAIGPRFTQMSEMAGPLTGLWLGHYLDASFKRVMFLRDCFPSGHTTQTLVAMYFGMRYLSKRRLAVIAGLSIVGLSIITATLYCRMHYAVDLMAALPLAAFGILSCEWMSRRLPYRIVVLLPVKVRAWAERFSRF